MKNDRLYSLDALRGFDMLFIMGFSTLIIAICNLFPSAFTEGIEQQMHHARWHGLTFYDTIFPLFLFLSGVSFPFSLAKQREKGISSRDTHLKVVKRGFKLVLLKV